MKQLGFLMNKEGNIKFFGEYQEQYNKNNPHQVHDSSFTIEVEDTNFFNEQEILSYNRDKGLYGKAIDLSLNGFVMMLNISNNENKAMILYVPEKKKMTTRQKEELSKMNNLLSSFDTVKIINPKSVFITDDDCFFNLEDFYGAYNINIQNEYQAIKTI